MTHLTIGYFSKGILLHEGTEDNTENISFLEEIIKKSTVITSRGISICRCCGSGNGTLEYSFKITDKHGEMWSFAIPEGYIHYLRDHKIQADINLLTLKNLVEKQ